MSLHDCQSIGTEAALLFARPCFGMLPICWTMERRIEEGTEPHEPVRGLRSRAIV